MKLRTSYFNGTVLRKDITRFAPVWGLYSICLLLALLLMQDHRNPAQIANELSDLLPGMSWINLFYAPLCATLLFGDLFQTRICNALHAMPMRREGWFLTHLSAGLLFALIPNLAVTLLSFVFLQKYFYMGLIWLGITMLQYLFYFGVAVFSALCAGNRLAHSAVYGLIQYIAVLVFWIIQLLYMPLLYGLQLDDRPFFLLSPSLQLNQAEYVLFQYGKPEGGMWGGFLPEDWTYLFILAGVGVALLIPALLLYRRRHLECAGDFIPLKPIRAIFLTVYSILVGVLLYALFDAFGSNYPHFSMAVGLFIGFFTGKMLLSRTVRVFRLKNWLVYFALTAAVGISLVLTLLDPLGLTRYIPQTQQIRSACIYGDTGVYGHLLEYTEPTDLEHVRSLHKLILEEQKPGRTGQIGHFNNISLRYTLHDGTEITRNYPVDRSEALLEAFGKLFTSPEYIMQSKNWDEAVANITMVEVDLHNLEKFDHNYPIAAEIYCLIQPEDIRGLMDAIYKDCLDGHMAQDWVFHPNQDVLASLWIGTTPTDDASWTNTISINGIMYEGQWFRDLRIYSDCTHTIAFLEEHLTSAQTGVSNGATLIPPG